MIAYKAYKTEEEGCAMTYPCNDCNFNIGISTCWYFGQMTATEMVKIAVRGCKKHRSWWTRTSVPNQV